jgi:hypothetical protein
MDRPAGRDLVMTMASTGDNRPPAAGGRGTTPSSSPRPVGSCIAEEKDPFGLDQVRVALNRAIGSVATDFAVSENGAVIRLSGDKVAHGVKNFIKSKLFNPADDWKIAMFCGKSPDEPHTAYRVSCGQIPKSDLPYAVLTVSDQRSALSAKTAEIEEGARRTNSLRDRSKHPLVRTKSVQFPVVAEVGPSASLQKSSPRGGEKKHKKDKSKHSSSKFDFITNPHATLRGVQRSLVSLVGQADSIKTIAHANGAGGTIGRIQAHGEEEEDLQPEILRRRYKTPLSDKLQVLEMYVNQLRTIYTLRGAPPAEGDQASSLLVTIERHVQDAIRTEKIRSECNREAHSMLSISLQMIRDLPLVFLAREVPVGTSLCIADSHKRRAPICGKIDLIFYDLHERCYVLADIKTTRVPVAEGEEDNSQIMSEYLFLKRVNVLQLQMYAALLEHASAGDIRVGYVLIMGFNPARDYTHSTWRVKFDPEFYLSSDFSASEASSRFYRNAPKNASGPTGFVGQVSGPSPHRPVAPYDSRYVVESGASGIRGPIFTWDELEALLPHRFDRSRNGTAAKH